MSSFALIGITFTLLVLGVFISHHTTPVVRACGRSIHLFSDEKTKRQKDKRTKRQKDKKAPHHPSGEGVRQVNSSFFRQKDQKTKGQKDKRTKRQKDKRKKGQKDKKTKTINNDKRKKLWLLCISLQRVELCASSWPPPLLLCHLPSSSQVYTIYTSWYLESNFGSIVCADLSNHVSPGHPP